MLSVGVGAVGGSGVVQKNLGISGRKKDGFKGAG